MTINRQNLNNELLESIAAEAVKALETSNRADAKRWINAIRKATNELTTNPYWNFDGTALLIKSDKSDKIYTSNGTCFDDKGELCKAFAQNQPCWHRSGARILKRLSEQA